MKNPNIEDNSTTTGAIEKIKHRCETQRVLEL